MGKNGFWQGFFGWRTGKEFFDWIKPVFMDLGTTEPR
jgi:hypothetical protein